MIEIKKYLDDYLEFDSSQLFDDTDYLVVFGGVLRDIISGQPDDINDIDILCLSKSRQVASLILEMNGYNSLPLIKVDFSDLYKHIKYIFEPKTYVKGKKIVQLITPSLYGYVFRYDAKAEYSKWEAMKRSFYGLLKNVDLSSSGTFYDGEFLYESITDSVFHCEQKIYVIDTHAMMYDTKRTADRANKLGYKWKEIEIGDKLILRKHKIHRILQSKNYPNIEDFKIKVKDNNADVRFRKFYIDTI